MVGKYEIAIGNKRIHYSFFIKRRITVVKGNSGTGKTTLLNLISEYNECDRSSGIRCSTNADVLYVLKNGDNYLDILSKYKDLKTILFVDEGVKFIKDALFVKELAKCGLYLVIISRDVLRCFDYSVNELYNLKTERIGVVSHTTFSPLESMESYAS